MPDSLQSLNSPLVLLLATGLFTILVFAFARWWRKHSSVLSTQVWMILITLGLSITMVLLFLFPIHRKAPSRDVTVN